LGDLVLDLDAAQQCVLYDVVTECLGPDEDDDEEAD